MAAIPEIPLPALETVAIAVLFYIAGATTPTYYAAERLRGFGRAVVSRLPYEPPPGMSTDEALRAAATTAIEVEEESEDEGGESG